MPPRLLPRLCGALLATVVLSPLLPAAPAAAERTSAVEARRVDRVPTPRIRWVPTADGRGFTGSVRLPLDYDRPRGSTVRIALFKLPAVQPTRRIGTLFVNPGGPGGSGVSMARSAASFLSPEVLDRFDIVGFDPRGTNRSTAVACFPSRTRQVTALRGRGRAHPAPAEQRAFIVASKRLAKACSGYGSRLASAMSTAQVARDLDVLRRSVGDDALSYLGFSYGSVLGQVYANLFPDRVRALALDGVLDPVAWVGTRATRDLPATTRLGSGEAAWAALRAGLAACREAGPRYCPLADPQAAFDRVATSLQRRSVRIGSLESGFDYRYADFVADILGLLYHPRGMDYVVQIVAVLAELEGADGGAALSARTRAGRLVREARTGGLSAAGYDNGLEAWSSVLCTDARQPRYARSWVAANRRTAERAPHLGPAWGWSDVQCATVAWRARDEDAYRGPFTRRTAAPVLLVGTLHDPATPYAGARAAAARLPGSVLLRNHAWGHTAYGTSECVTGRVDAYLLTGRVPSGTAEVVCTGALQPFTEPLEGPGGYGTGSSRTGAPSRAGLPPVRAPWLPR